MSIPEPLVRRAQAVQRRGIKDNCSSLLNRLHNISLSAMGMEVLILMVSLIGSLITASRFASTVRCEVSLPQDATDACKAIRNAVLAQNKNTFTLKQALHGFALVNMTKPEVGAVALQDPFTRYYATAYLGMARTNKMILEQYNNATFGQEITDILEYIKISDFFQSSLEPVIGEYVRSPSRYEAFIDDQTKWISDKFFTQQRLAGTNPLSIKRVTIHGEEEGGCGVKTTDGKCCSFPFRYRGKVYEECTTVDHHKPWCFTTGKYRGRRWGVCEEEPVGPVGLDWNKLKKTLNPAFDWEEAVQEVLDSDVSLENAIKQGRIYALRYELCDDLPRAEDLTDRDPRRTVWTFLSPIALFASKRVGRRSNELVPVAIQMDYRPESAVYTPKDGDNWMLAKLNVQITDFGYAQLAEHLAKVHYFMEPFCVSLKRTLPPAHPLNQILKYHCREVNFIDVIGSPDAGDVGFTELLFAFGSQGMLRLLKDTQSLTTWEVTDYRKNIKSRGLDDRKLLPYFPFRDDGIKILLVIEAMVKDYVNLYYKDDKGVKEDVELQAYLNEVSLTGTGPNGGIGRIQGLPASIDSKEELCDVLSRILSHVTIRHAAVNYAITDYQRYIPNQPTKLYNDTRVENEEFSVFRLPNRLTTATQSAGLNFLGTFRFDTLFDYGNELEDINAVNLVNGYYNYLMHVVQPRMQEENRKRKERGQLTYPYFIPRWLTNSIQA